jgi:signal transduction histidine kinase
MTFCGANLYDKDGAVVTAARRPIFFRVTGPKADIFIELQNGHSHGVSTPRCLMVQKISAMSYSITMRVIHSAIRRGGAAWGGLLVAALLVGAGPVAPGEEPEWRSPLVLTNVAQLRRFSLQEPGTAHPFRLEGNIWWVSPARERMVLHDASGAVELEFDLTGHPVQPGQRVRLEGAGAINWKGANIRITPSAPAVSPGVPLRLEVMGREAFPEMHWLAIGQTLREGDEDSWAEVEGEVTLASERPDGLLVLELSAMGGRMRVEVGDASGLSAATLLNRRIRAMGFCQSAFTTTGQKVPGVLLVPGRKEIELIGTAFDDSPAGSADTNATSLAVQTTASDINQMKREEAQRGYPVKIQGVVICVVSNRPAFIVQDATRAVYVVVDSSIISELPPIGTYLRVEGKTDKGSFAPIVRARGVDIVGLGNLPEPLQPTWDQLMNGSLDDQWVELKGVVVSVAAIRPAGWVSVRLRTQAGTLQVDFRMVNMNTGTLAHLENALVRFRGCLFVSWDSETSQVRRGVIRMFVNDLIVEQSAPADLFSAPQKTAAELMLFDSEANAFQRVKVSGQVVHVRGLEHFMMDGTNGVRFLAREPLGLAAGDQVEAAGFPELGDAAPVLCEAWARKTGRGSLPKPKELSSDNLIRPDNDSIRVRVEALLANVRWTPTNQVLEMQTGPWRFLARLNLPDESVRLLRPGSRLGLTGVYAARAGNRVPAEDVGSFDLLLNSSKDIDVLAMPPWWTLRKLLVIVGIFACVLAGMVLWITQLHRQVEKRTAEVEIHIQNRQRVEHQREMEQERARIAHDLHDELGSGITEIGMLAARAKSASAPDEKRNRYLDEMGGKAREMVTALDEIVWAMNPAHDSLASLVSYLCLYADHFLGLANITWRLEGPPASVELAVDSKRRHQLFLVFKEALTNIVRHAGATEVRLGIQVEQDQLQLIITDNGRGLPSNARTREMDGVNSMRSRIEKLGGKFEIAGEAGQGTTVRLQVPTK